MLSLQVLGALVSHVGSGVSFEVQSALETLFLLASKYAHDLLPLSCHINGIFFVLPRVMSILSSCQLVDTLMVLHSEIQVFWITWRDLVLRIYTRYIIVSWKSVKCSTCHCFTGFMVVQVYEVFSHLLLSARSSSDSYGSSVANELLMIVRKQVL